LFFEKHQNIYYITSNNACFPESEKTKASTRVIKINGDKVVVHNPGNTTGTKVKNEIITSLAYEMVWSLYSTFYMVLL
jgi:hypothetical protein